MDRGAWWATVHGIEKLGTTGHTSKIRTQLLVTPWSSAYPSTACLLWAFLPKEAIWDGIVTEPSESRAKLLVVV